MVNAQARTWPAPSAKNALSPRRQLRYRSSRSCAVGANSAGGSYISVRQLEGEPGLPPVQVGLDRRVGQVDLQAGGPALDPLGLGDVPGQVALGRPVQQIPGRLDQGVRV